MIGIIIQARMGSTRLPGKILKDFGGKTLLEHILFRLDSKLKESAQIVIATSDLPNDDIVEFFCKRKGVECFRGDEQNVLSRYYLCAKEQKFEHVIRLTGDNPFPDIEEMNHLIAYHVDNNMDFTENFSTLPVGVGMEIFTFNILEESMNKASLPKHFEHADEYILDNLENYKTGVLKNQYPKEYRDIRLTVDTQEDYEKACFIIKHAKAEYINIAEAVTLSEKYEQSRRGDK